MSTTGLNILSMSALDSDITVRLEFIIFLFQQGLPLNGMVSILDVGFIIVVYTRNRHFVFGF